MVEALLTLAVSDQGKLSTEFSDLATWAEDAIDAAAPEIERLDLHVAAVLNPAETAGDPQLMGPMLALELTGKHFDLIREWDWGGEDQLRKELSRARGERGTKRKRKGKATEADES